MGSRRDPVKVGIVGCGRVAQLRHLPALSSLPDTELVAVADSNPGQLKLMADEFGIKACYSDYRALLDDRSIDAVGICVPAQFHVEIAMAALDAGKHLFIEKPLALSLSEAQRLITRARSSPLKVMIGFNLRWHRLVRRAREMIEGQTLGYPHLMLGAFTTGTRLSQDAPEWRRRRELGGGILFEHACHFFDLWRFLLRSEVEEVFAMTQSDDSEDTVATVTAQMTSGALVASAFSDSTTQLSEMRIHGNAGQVDLSLYRFDGLRFVPLSQLPGDGRARLEQAGRFVREFPHAVRNAWQTSDFERSFAAEWKHFADAVRGDSTIECSLEDGESALRVALAALKSASLGEPVRVSEAPSGIMRGPEDMRVERD